ncbi:MAG TPA: DNA-formamidopyrimidine glycosylase family protein [Vicinamibacterales bacterium]|nr:DNA-formamidopyrimidine glycosylase family protein [Vicinamibacterales bacterium]
MPEGDTIHRAARTLHTALSGQRIEHFESVLAHLTRVDADAPIAGRVVERVEARGKHLLMWLSEAEPSPVRRGASLVLRTHMRMHGSWHIYRPGERWQRPRHEMRIVIATAPYVAVAFAVPVAEFVDAVAVEREGPIAELGPDPLSDSFDAAAAVARLQARGEVEIADALLDQRAIAGIGNVFKSEILFAAGVSPFTPVRALSADTLARVVAIAGRQMRANAGDAGATAIGGRRTTNRLDPSARLWVYGRSGLSCRRCGTPIQRARQGPDVRSTYWCERCQPREYVEANL